MKPRSRPVCLLLAGAILLAALASCQGKADPAEKNDPGTRETAVLPSPTEAPEASEPSAAPAPPPQASPTPKASPSPEPVSAAPDTPPPTESPAPPPEESPPPPEPEAPEGLVIRGGLTYLSDGSGGVVAREPGLCDYDGYTYYFREDGSIAADEVISLEGGDYAFDSRGRWMSPLRAAVEASATAEKTSQLVLVVDHNLTFWEKAEDGSWRLGMDTYCGYGGNGLVEADSRIMGTRTTPIGAFPLTLAFGLGPDPGTGMTYRQITETSYWSAEDDDTYNTWVESEKPLAGEHLMDYYQYKYAVNIGFNLDPPDHSRGCAIFLHCKSTNSWHTAGCVSLTEEDMLELLLALRDGAYMIIVPDAAALSAY